MITSLYNPYSFLTTYVSFISDSKWKIMDIYIHWTNAMTTYLYISKHNPNGRLNELDKWTGQK